MKSILKTATLIGSLIILSACYELESVKPSSRFNMSGINASSIKKGEDYFGLGTKSLLLVGNRAYPDGVPDFSFIDIVESSNIGTDFTITGATSAFDFYNHGSHGYIHINTPDSSQKLNLYSVYGTSVIGSVTPSGRLLKPALSYTLNAGPREFRFTEICGLASPSQRKSDVPGGLVWPGIDEHHLLMSVKACDVDSPNYCIGAVIDTWLPSLTSFDGRWRMHSDQRGPYAATFKPNGTYFSNECMPIESTRGHNRGTSEQKIHTLAMLDPSMHEISLYNSKDLVQGRLGSLRAPTDHRILDFSIEAYNNNGTTTDSATLVVLYQRGSTKVLSHYAIVNNQFFPTPFLTETVRADAHHIIVEVGSTDTGSVYVIGDDGTNVRRYRKAD